MSYDQKKKALAGMTKLPVRDDNAKKLPVKDNSGGEKVSLKGVGYKNPRHMSDGSMKGTKYTYPLKNK